MNNKSDLFNKIFNAFILIGMAVVTVIVTAIKLGDAESGQTLLIIAAASEADLAALVGPALARRIHEQLNHEQQ